MNDYKNFRYYKRDRGHRRGNTEHKSKDANKKGGSNEGVKALLWSMWAEVWRDTSTFAIRLRGEFRHWTGPAAMQITGDTRDWGAGSMESLAAGSGEGVGQGNLKSDVPDFMRFIRGTLASNRGQTQSVWAVLAK